MRTKCMAFNTFYPIAVVGSPTRKNQRELQYWRYVKHDDTLHVPHKEQAYSR